MFNFELNKATPFSEHNECIVVAIYENKKLTPSAKIVDTTLNNIISSLFQRDTLCGKYGQIFTIPLLNETKASFLIIVGAGCDKDITELRYRDIIRSCTKTVVNLNIAQANFYLSELPVANKSEHWKVRTQVQYMAEFSYPINARKSIREKASTLNKIMLNTKVACEPALKQALAISRGVKICKDLSNLPPNICTPSYLAHQALLLADQYPDLTTTVVDEEEMAALGMNTLLSVGAGSVEPSKLVVMNYRGGAENDQPHVLVGKGISFDTGGICLKNREGMVMMKYDMCGSAAVIGAVAAACDLKLPLNIIAVIACAENMPGSKASKPSDVVTSLSGKTVEILNTDAEGRLVLCDTLSYVERFNPVSVVDVATLTGACVMALGNHYSGLFANDQSLADQLLDAGLETLDKAWQLPLAQEDMPQIDSDFADIANMGDGSAGAVVAALFLSRFAERYPWAHLDISGSAKQTKPRKEATGRPVPLLVQYFINLAQ